MWGTLTGRWVPHDVRDEVVDYVRQWSERTELTAGKLVKWIGIGSSKFYDWKRRYGQVNERNGLVPRDHWLEACEKLGSMGAPIKVQVGKETVFLCCKGCMNQQINPEHWATIHANAAKAQRICPVMKHEISKNPKWTIVEGQIVYVCCPPCKKKIAADPQKYLREVDELYAASLDARKLVR